MPAESNNCNSCPGCYSGLVNGTDAKRKTGRQAPNAPASPLTGTASASFRVTLPRALTAYVQRCAASGWYLDANEVLANAVRTLKAKNEILIG